MLMTSGAIAWHRYETVHLMQQLLVVCTYST
jgi:hypothetical protein